MEMQIEVGPSACQFCERYASHCCKCSDPPALFCMDCCHYHRAQLYNTTHQILPITTLGERPQEYLRKSEALARGAVAMRKSVERLEQFSREFDELMQQCIASLTEYRSLWLQRMQTEKQELLATIEAAVQETTHSLDQGLVLMSPLAQALWTFSPEELQLVSYSVALPDMQTFCQSLTSYQNHLQDLCEPFSYQVPRDSFASVWGDTVELYDLKSRQSAKHTLSVDFGHGGSYVQINRLTLLCLGAYPASDAAYELDISSFQLTLVSSLRVPRAWAGVAKAQHFVFVFGGKGDDKRLKSCEKYELREKQWLPMDSMQERRSNFTPCTYRSLIYLLCPVTPLIETFSPDTEAFTVLPISLPPQLDYGSVSFVVNGELCVLTDDRQMALWKIETETEFRLCKTERECWSTQPPLVFGCLVLIANEGRVEKWSLESQAFL